MLKPTLRCRALKIGYKKQDVCLNPNYGINLDADAGELICLLGANGIGKSTLLRTLTGKLWPLSGQVFIRNDELSGLKVAQLSRIVASTHTENRPAVSMQVHEYVALGRTPYTNWMGKLKQTDRQVVAQSLSEVMLTHHYHTPVNHLSDGEMQRAQIARTLAQETPIIVLDEPTAFLDIANKYNILKILKNLARHSRKTILITTHDLTLALQEADKIWLLSSDGAHQGAPEDMIIENRVAALFNESALKFDPIHYAMSENSAPKFAIRANVEDKTVAHLLKKALTRIQYTSNNIQKSTVRLSLQTNSAHRWILEYGNKQVKPASFYELIKLLNTPEIKKYARV